MTAEAVSFSNIRVPSEDCAVTTAFSELEAKLAAWTNAAADVQQKLAACGAPFTNACAPSGGADVARTVMPAQAAVLDAAQRDIEGLTEEDTAILESLEADMATVVRVRYCMLDGRRSIEDLVDDEEQAWLSSLDSDMANAIRVQRRLFKERKNIRELAAQYETESEAKKVKRTWWERITA